MKLRFGIWSLLLFTVLSCLYLGLKPAWYGHLHTDIVVHYQRASHFKNNLSLVGLVGNEYQPGAIVYFSLLSLPLFFYDNFNTFLYTTFFANIVIVFLIAWLYQIQFKDKKSKNLSLILLTVILATQGPVFLFRFDLMVMLFVLGGFYLWYQKWWMGSILAISFAILTKIFPIIFIPFFVIQAYKKSGIKFSLVIGWSYLISILSMLYAYMFFYRVSFDQLVGSWNFLKNVPVNTESVWASLFSFWTVLTQNQLPKSLGAWGTFGIHPDYVIGSMSIYSSISFLVLGLFYIWFLFTKKKFANAYHIPLVIILTFLTFSRTLHAQYQFWYLLFIPLLGAKTFFNKKNRNWQFYLVLILIMNLMFQYIYPLNFTAVTSFYGNQEVSSLFWINLLRNILLIILWVRLMFFETVFAKKSLFVNKS